MIYGGLMAGQSAVQGILADPVAVQNCLIGTRRVALDGKVYRYGSASGDCSTEVLACTTNRLQCLSWSAVVSGALGSTSLVVTVGAGDGPAADGVMPANYLAGGQLQITNLGVPAANARGITSTIISNTGCAATGPITIVISEPLPLEMVNTYKVEAMGSIYRLVHGGLPADGSAIGRPTSPATAALPYHWLQTWGPCWLVPNNGWVTVDVGNTIHNNQVVLYGGGGISAHDDDVATVEYQQHIGFVLSRANAGTTQGAPFIMLQISP